MPPIIVTRQQTWETLLAQLPNPHALQRWEWGEFKARWGWQPTRLAWQNATGHPLAAAQILRRPIFNTPWNMLYVAKGPACNYTDPDLVQQVLGDLETFARQNRAIFIKIDPDVPLACGPAEDAPIHPPGQVVKRLLNTRGWRYSTQQIQFKNTVLLNISLSEEALLAAMKPKTRYNIRLAARKGVTVRQGGLDDLETFYQLYAVTSRRDGFVIRPQAYYMDVWQHYLQANAATLLLAWFNGAPIAGVMLFYSGQTAWYMYGASNNSFRNVMPNHLLQWEAMKAAQEAGCTTYDMWGAPDIFNASDPMWGVYRFKLGFGGLTRHGLGAYDYPVYSTMYNLYVRLLPQVLAWLRRIR